MQMIYYCIGRSPISSTADYCALRPNIADIEAWSLKNCLKFNVDKCKYLVIIDKIISFKYLGLNLSSVLSWSNHIDLICAKTRKLLGFVGQKVLQPRWL